MANPCSQIIEVRRKLVGLYQNEPENLLRVLFALNDDKESWSKTADKSDPCNGEQSEKMSPCWRTLKATLISEKFFSAFSMTLINNSKEPRMNTRFRETIETFHAGFSSTTSSQGFCPESAVVQMVKSCDPSSSLLAAPVTTFQELHCCWSLMSPSTQAEVMEIIPEILHSDRALVPVSTTIDFFHSASTTLTNAVLLPLKFSGEILEGFRRWGSGEITEKRFTKILIDSTSKAGVWGAGAWLGCCIVPTAVMGTTMSLPAGILGLLAGGLMSNWIFSTVSGYSLDKLTEMLLKIPKSESVEKAYSFFGVNCTASNHDINDAYRKLCLKHHPDKGGRQEDFFFVQVNMGLIKLDRNCL